MGKTERRPDEDTKIADLLKAIMQHQQVIKRVKKNYSVGKKSKENISRRGLTCRNYGEAGHLKNRCRKLVAVRNNSGSKRNQGNKQ